MAHYQGKYRVFDAQRIQTYPVRTRVNRTHLADLVAPEAAAAGMWNGPESVRQRIAVLADRIVEARRAGHPVLAFSGGHLIKNGLGLLLADLVKRGLLTLIAGNAATAIHDFELALLGATSEHVPDGLRTGRFGMAAEFGYINEALRVGDRAGLGFGESLGRTIVDEVFRAEVLATARGPDTLETLAHPEASLLAVCYRADVPFTVHAGIGVDVIDQHPSFDGAVKGACSGRDFLIYVDQIARCAKGGIVLNIGSAVQGPEVLLKAVSMASNAGVPPMGLATADFDLAPYEAAAMADESALPYYRRNHKSIVTRVPQAFGGLGLYIQGDQKDTVPEFYRAVLARL